MGSLVRRCTTCRKAGAKYSATTLDCGHPEQRFGIKYRVGRKQVFKTLGQNKREAERLLLKIESEIACSGSFQEMKPILFKDLAKRWYRNHELGANPKPGTLWTYDVRLRYYILPNLGQKITNQISASDLEDLKLKLREKLSARYTNAILVTIGSIFKLGMTLDFCRSNPVQFVKRFKVDKGVGITLTMEEATALIEHSPEPYRTIFFATLSTGTRIGEITGIMWKDVNFKEGTISIQRNVFYGPKNKYAMKDQSWIFGTPKSKESVRKVAMPPALQTALLLHSERSQGNPLSLVFCTKNGRPFDRSTLRKKLLLALETAGLKHCRLHDFRHSNATWLLANGANLAAVSKHLGHSGVGITGDFYHHVTPKDYETNAKIMSGIFPKWDTNGIPKLPEANDATQK